MIAEANIAFDKVSPDNAPTDATRMGIWIAAEDDRLIGGLWAALSEERCRFVMVKEKRWKSYKVKALQQA